MMFPPRFLKRLKSQPSILVFIIVLLILCSGRAVFLGYKHYHDALEKALLADGIVARMAAMLLQEHEKATIGALASYASRPLLVDSVKSRDAAGLHLHLADLKKNNNEIDLIFVTDDKGILLANHPVFPDAVGQDLSDRNWYKGVASDWTPYVSSVFHLLVADDAPLAIAVAVPVRDADGSVIGVLANSHRLAFIDTIFKSLHLDTNGIINLIDQTGHIIYSSNLHLDRVTDYPLYPSVREALRDQRTQLEVIVQNGRQDKKFLTIAPLDFGWTVVVERGRREVLRLEYGRFLNFAGFGLLLFLLVTGVVVYQHFLREKTLTLLQLEKELRQSEKRYKSLIENTPDIIYSFSGRQSDSYYSPMVESVLGYSPEYLKSHPTFWHDSIHPDDLPKVDQAMREAESGRKVELEYRIYDIHGRCRWLSDHMTGSTDENGQPLTSGHARDITDRKTAEEALRRSRERYRSLVENMLDGFAYCRMLYDDRGQPIDYVYLEVNNAFVRLTGRTDVVGKKFSEVFPDPFEGKQDLLECYSRVASTGTSQKFELEFEPLSLWLDRSVASDEVGYFLVIFSDITSRKLMEKQRQEALDLLQNITDRIPGVVFQFRLNRDGTVGFPFVSKGLHELYRLTPEEVREDASCFLAVHHPEVQNGIIASIHKSARNLTPWTHEYRLKFSDGTEHWMSGGAMPQREEDGSTLWHGVITDVTERKQVEDALRESEARLSTAARVAGFGVYSYDFASGQSFYSPEFLLLFGLPADAQLELDGDLVAKALHPDDKPAFLARMRAAIDPCGPGTLEQEYRIIRTDGEVRWLRVIGETVFTGNLPGDRPLHANGIVQDITERRQAEEQLRTLNDELERRVEKRTRELQETQAHYLHAEKLSAIGKLSASIAHEFNSPLQAVLTVLKGLKLSVALGEEESKLLDAAIGESERMKNLIRSLQDFNRPSSGRKVLMDVHASLDSLLILCKSEFRRKGISTVLNYTERLPQILAIPDQIKQVLLNLLNNAADACLQSGGVITVSTRHEGKRVAVAIQDTGTGIPPENIELIFQPFFTTKPEVKGTGLGLPVCHGIVQNHHGEILVESQPGQGSTFTVLLPIDGEG